MPGSFFYLRVNMEISHIIKAITMITARIPTTNPALKIPPITEHPLRAVMASTNNIKLMFFI